jgi:hypothetical protein
MWSVLSAVMHGIALWLRRNPVSPLFTNNHWQHHGNDMAVDRHIPFSHQHHSCVEKALDKPLSGMITLSALSQPDRVFILFAVSFTSRYAICEEFHIYLYIPS